MTIQELFKMAADREVPELLSIPKEGVVLNVGAGEKLFPNTIALDLPEWDAETMPLPFGNETVDGIYCFNFLEHVSNPVKVLFDFQRVLKAGGIINIGVPHYSSLMAFQDLNHQKFFTAETWKILFDNPYYRTTEYAFKLRVHANFIMGIVERNLFLCTQMVKEK